MRYTGFIFRIKLSCPDCNNAIPINRLTDEVECPNCYTKVSLYKNWWKENVFSDENMKEANECAEGEAQTASVFGSMKYDIAYGKRFPRCQDCKDELSENEKWTIEDLKTAADSSGFIQCKKCNDVTSIRKQDEFINSFINFPVHAILAEDAGEKGDTKFKGKPMMFACLNCGAGLKADGTDRVVTCEYCDTDNFLPEDLWRRLHPVPKPKVLFLLAEY